MKRILALFRRRNLDQRLNEEMDHHLALLKADFEAQGHSPEQAKILARRSFGSTESIRDQHRDARGLPWLEDALGDLKHALRQLRHAPGFTAIAILTMALGIGANTAIFTLVNAALLREAPYPQSERLKDLTRSYKGKVDWPVFDSRQFKEFRDNLKSFAYVAAMRDRGSMNWIQKDSALELKALRISADYFRALGIEPRSGRSFSRQEESAEPAPVAIVSHRYATLLGQTMNLGGKPHTVVGVLPEDFPNQQIDVYLPMPVQPVKDGDNTYVFGRLKPDATRIQANEEATALYRSLLKAEYPEYPLELGINLEPFLSAEGRGYRSPLYLLSGAAALILIIACVNLANLLLARSSVRVRELAIRSSLGAGRFRLARQMLVESTLLSLLGGLAGFGVGGLILPLLLYLSPVKLEELWTIRMDYTVFAYTVFVSLATGLLFGIVPAWISGHAQPIEAMKASGARTSSARGGALLRRSLVVAEIALSVILLAGAGVFLKILSDLLALPSGADESRVIAAQMSLRGERYDTSTKAARFFEAGLAKLQALPGVESASVTLALPLERGLNCSVLLAPEERKFINWRYKSPNYLESMRVPLLKGRYLSDLDHANSAPVAIVSEAFVNRYLKDRDPIGTQVVEQCGGKINRTIVGVVADVKTNSLRDKPAATMYVIITQANDAIVKASHTWFPMSWVVRARDDNKTIAKQIEQQLRAVDPLTPIHKYNTMEDLRARAVSNDRFLVYLIAAFAVLALALTTAGVYGVLTFVVSQGGMEYSIRLAIGAPIRQLALTIFGDGFRPAAIGLVLGSAAAFGLIRWLIHTVPGLLPQSNASFLYLAAPLACLFFAVFTDCLAPAVRVARLDPNESLSNT